MQCRFCFKQKLRTAPEDAPNFVNTWTVGDVDADHTTTALSRNHQQSFVLLHHIEQESRSTYRTGLRTLYGFASSTASHNSFVYRLADVLEVPRQLPIDLDHMMDLGVTALMLGRIKALMTDTVKEVWTARVLLFPIPRNWNRFSAGVVGTIGGHSQMVIYRKLLIVAMHTLEGM
jgi:hypothetical protein